MNDLYTTEDMREIIKGKNIVIIGGHINWVNKLKRTFTNWKFIDANTERPNDFNNLLNADLVYFYTNHLSHRIYKKMITILRQNNIHYGYLHTINNESIVHQIYGDLIRKGVIEYV